MKSLRLRLLLGTLFWIVLSLLVAGVGLGKLFYQHASEQLYNELHLHLDQLTARLDFNEDGELQLSDKPTDPRFSKPLSGLYWQIILFDASQKDGEPLRSRSLWDQRLEVPVVAEPLVRLTLSWGQGENLLALARAVELDGQAVQLTVAANESFLQEPVTEFQHELWLSLLVLGAGLILAALVQVWMGLSPLKRLRHALQHVRNGKNKRLEGSFPQEVMPLVDDFNSVLKQNAQMVARAQTQAGNLAHALKTPLTLLANAAYAAPENSLSELINIQVSVARAQVDYHLKHARAAANAQRSHAQTPVLHTLQSLIRVLGRLYAERALNFELKPVDSALMFKGEQQDLQEMLGNLLDNACKWAVNTVQVSANLQAQQLLICVEDDGCGVADAQKTQVLERGVRGDEKVQGSGLGLAIVADLAQLYGGELQLADSALGGLRAELYLPVFDGQRP